MSKQTKNSLLGIRPGTFAELCGWYGMLALILAYFLVSFGLINGQGLVFQLINITGALGLLVIAASKGIIQSVILNLFWAAIGVVTIARLLLQ